MVMYTFLRILIWLLWLCVLIFHIKAYRFNKQNKNLVIASFEKDIRPFWLLWLIRLILFIFMLFYKWISVNGWSYVSDRFEEAKKTIINNKDIEDSNVVWSNDGLNNNTKRWIINDEQLQQIEYQFPCLVNVYFPFDMFAGSIF